MWTVERRVDDLASDERDRLWRRCTALVRASSRATAELDDDRLSISIDVAGTVPLAEWTSHERSTRDHLALIAALCRSLHALHRAGVSHGAVDADSVRVSGAGEVVLVGHAWLLAGRAPGSARADQRAVCVLARQGMASRPIGAGQAIVDAALARGAETRATERWPTVDCLAAELERGLDARSRRRRALAAGLGIAGAVCLALAATIAIINGPRSDAASTAAAHAEPPPAVGWGLDTLTPGMYAAEASEHAFSGEHSVRLWSTDGARRVEPGDSGAVVQWLAADHYRGKHVRVIAALRGHIDDGVAILVLSSDGDGSGPAPRVPMTVADEWRELSVERFVLPTASEIAVGVRLEGRGELWIDDVRIETVAKAANPIPAVDAPLMGLDFEPPPSQSSPPLPPR